MATIAHSYASIEKMDKNDDGTLTVYGKATDDSIDSDLQICDEEWLKKAMPDWMMSGGNVREQHSNIAAGVATDYEQKKDGHYITALVVDPTSVKKVETGVLKGFSIGIRSPRVIRDEKAIGGRIVDGQIVEVSLVDRPANPNAKLMLAKAAESGLLMAVTQGAPTPADVFGKSAATEEAVEESTSPEIAVPEVEDAASAEEVVSADPESEKAASLLNLVKGFRADLDKFDQATFDRARKELANLIIVEAQEMADEGHNEKDSIEHLLDSVKHLFRWYEGEVEAGEVADPIDTDHEEAHDDILAPEAIELADKPAFGEKPADEKPADSEDEADAEKMCDKCDKALDECKCDKEADVSAKSLALNVDDAQLEQIISKAVASAKASVTEEIDQIAKALEAERAEKAQLADELATAKKAVMPGGPKRSLSAVADKSEVNQLLVKAAELRLKASDTLDKDLAKGYRDWADDLEAKASRKDV